MDHMVKYLVLIEFDKYNELLDKEEVCTLMNYILTHHGSAMHLMQMLTMARIELKKQIRLLKEIGY
jgi:hypothetical protein